MLKNKSVIHRMKKALIDQILVWTILLVGFITLLFMILDYSSIVRLKNNIDTLALYGVRLIAIGRESDKIIESLNRIKNKYYTTIVSTDLVCDEVWSLNFRATFHVIGTYSDAKILTFDSDILGKASAFNEKNETEITCTLTLNHIS